MLLVRGSLAEVVDQVAPVHIEHGAGGDEALKPTFSRKLQSSTAVHSAPLWLRKATFPGARHAVREGGVQPFDRIHHPQAIGPDHAHFSADDARRSALQSFAVLAVLLKAGGDDDGCRNAQARRFANHVGTRIGRRAYNHQIDLSGNSASLGYALMPRTLGRLELTGKTVPPNGLLSRFHSTERPTLPGTLGGANDGHAAGRENRVERMAFGAINVRRTGRVLSFAKDRVCETVLIAPRLAGYTAAALQQSSLASTSAAFARGHVAR